MATTDYDPAHTVLYIPQTDVGTILHISRNHVARMEKSGLLPTADVWIAAYLRGWDPYRISRFATEAGLIDADGNKAKGPASSPARKQETKDLITASYSEPTRLYLGTVLVAALLGREYSAVYAARDRDQWESADVQVGTRFGWDEQRVIRFGQQSGRIGNARVDEWMIERTADYGLDPLAPWILERIEAGTASSSAVAEYQKAAESHLNAVKKTGSGSSS